MIDEHMAPSNIYLRTTSQAKYVQTEIPLTNKASWSYADVAPERAKFAWAQAPES
jgi:hypothetical protein